ncbi:MAG: hypothetical protein ACKV2T_27675 [Kofleriaceae bacterium]
MQRDPTSNCDEAGWWNDSPELTVPSPIIQGGVSNAPPAPETAHDVATDETPTDRPPTPDEIERCARLLVITAACGLDDDLEFGWMQGKKQRKSMVTARSECSVSTIGFTEGGRELPVKLLDASHLATLETAAKRGCSDLMRTLDQVDPRIGEAGQSAP